MPVASVSVHRHDRYTPGLRDKIADALRVPLSESAYHVLTPPLLRELANAVADRAPVLSFYLELTPERRIGGAWRSYLSSMSDTMLRPIEDSRMRRALRQEFASIEQAMEQELPVLAAEQRGGTSDADTGRTDGGLAPLVR
jgi:hypothetical protein